MFLSCLSSDLYGRSFLLKTGFNRRFLLLLRHTETKEIGKSLEAGEASSGLPTKECNLYKQVRGQKVLGKSVMVLKSRDVCIRGDTVFMPTLMEMALLKKPEKEQFKRDVKILQEMSESDVREKLIEIFPYLEHQR